MGQQSDSSSQARGEYDGPRPGDVVADKYRIEQVIGAGGMGVVLAARHIHLNQRVAIKFLRGKAHPELVGRFMREARAAAALSSEHVVRVTDVDKQPSGEPFMVMEYLTGRNLSKVIRSYGAQPMPLGEVADYITQTCRAIGEAHSLGIVHRDLKPGNLFETTRADGSRLVKVLDFGISKIIDDPGAGDEQTLTATNMILGSPQYASPEQLRSVKSVDTRTDIWAIGVIMYYMLTGKRPFEADNLSALCLMIATESPTPIKQLRPDLPDDLDQLVMRCLHKKREQRVQTAGEIIEALRPYYLGQDGRRAEPSSAGVDGAAPTSVPSRDLPTPPIFANGPVGPSGGGVGDGARQPMPLALVPSADSPSFAAPRGVVAGSTHFSRSAGPSLMLPSGEIQTGATRSAWTAAPQTNRQKTIAVGAALVVGVLVAVIAIQFKRSGEPVADTSQIESVDGVGPAATPTVTAPPPPRAVSTGIVVGTGQDLSSSKPKTKRPDGRIEGVVGEHAMATRPTTMLSRPGEGTFTGTLAPNQRVIIERVSGDFVYVAWLTPGLRGWVRKTDLRKIPEL